MTDTEQNKQRHRSVMITFEGRKLRGGRECSGTLGDNGECDTCDHGWPKRNKQ